jgi:hypothetical protein
MERCLALVLTAGLLAAPRLTAQSAQPVPAGTARAARMQIMKRDLRRLIGEQEHFFLTHRVYAHSVSQLRFTPAVSGGVSLRAFGTRGWNATIATDEEAGLFCGIFVRVGTAPNPVVTKDSEPACWRRLRDGQVVSEY